MQQRRRENDFFSRYEYGNLDRWRSDCERPRSEIFVMID